MMGRHLITITLSVPLWLTGAAVGMDTPPAPDAHLLETFVHTMPRTLAPMPLYEGEIPNSIPTPDQESAIPLPAGLSMLSNLTMLSKVSRPTLTAYLPAPARASRAAVLVLPGGGYTALSVEMEGARVALSLQDRGVAAFVLKYRLPSDATMRDKSIGPLQDAQQALRLVRQHANEWNIDPGRVGVIGFSAGGHLASTLGTHFEKSYVDNPDNINLRPDFMVLVYPVITMLKPLTHSGSREALLGARPSDELVKLFSNELQVSAHTPPTLLLAAGDDALVDVDNSINFYNALRHHGVLAQLVLFPQGQHGFFNMSRDEWMSPIWKWLEKGGWAKP